MTVPNWIRCLATSRKFWIAVLAEVGAVTLYAQGALSADQLADTTVALAGLVIAGIAGEDMAKSLGGSK